MVLNMWRETGREKGSRIDNNANKYFDRGFLLVLRSPALELRESSFSFGAEELRPESHDYPCQETPVAWSREHLHAE
jgi:hypothetical protein